MGEPVWIEQEEALVIHDLLLSEHGGREGMRDRGALQSALARPKNLFSYSAHLPSLADMAAAYAVGISRTHPFVDGNKRTALVVSLTFLELNGIRISAPQEEIYLVFLRLAERHMSEKQLSHWLETHSEQCR